MNLILEFHIIFLSLQIRQTIKNNIQTSEICKELMDKWIFQLMLRPELCLAERVPTSARQNFLYLQTNFGKSSQAPKFPLPSNKFWQELASTRSAKHDSAVCFCKFVYYN